jgi:hypothetical protein
VKLRHTYECFWSGLSARDKVPPNRGFAGLIVDRTSDPSALGREKQRMRLGRFYEHQLPQPRRERGEQKMFNDPLDQIELDGGRTGGENVQA